MDGSSAPTFLASGVKRNTSFSFSLSCSPPHMTTDGKFRVLVRSINFFSLKYGATIFKPRLGRVAGISSGVAAADTPKPANDD